MKIIAITILSFLILFDAISQSKQSEERYIGPKKGYLIIIGGGVTPKEVRERFIQLAGDKNASIVFIPTASDDAEVLKESENFINAYKKRGIMNVTAINTRSKNEANDEKFYKVLETATGVFIGGGKQHRLSEAYLGTKTLNALFDLLDRGGVIGGSSAGATIQGSYLMGGKTRKTSDLSKLDNAYDKGFGFVKHAAIDQHLLKRNRQLDLVPIITQFPEILGIGIEESSAIEIHKNSLTVLGNSTVLIYDNNDWNRQTKETGNVTSPYIILGENQIYDLRSRRIIK